MINFILIIILLYSITCRLEEQCKIRETQITCLNHPLCKWNENSKKEHKCEAYPCRGRDPSKCDPSLCRLKGEECISCYELKNSADCYSVGCCWYVEQCHNYQANRCQFYDSVDECINGIEDSKCYWNPFEKSCGSLPLDCSQYKSSDECSKTTTIGDPCFWYGNSCNNDLQDDCNNYNGDDCNQMTQLNGVQCYWINGICNSGKLSTCDSYITQSDCNLNALEGNCYWYNKGLWDACYNSPPELCSYLSKDTCNVSYEGPCYWYNNDCNNIRTNCHNYSNKDDCRSNTDPDGDECYWYVVNDVGKCLYTSQDCTSYISYDDCTNNKGILTGGTYCYWYSDSCHNELQSCNLYENVDDCNQGSGSECYWYGTFCRDYKEKECIHYSTQIACQLGTVSDSPCYWYHSKCNNNPGPCSFYNNVDDCNQGTLNGESCYWFNNSCHSNKLSMCPVI
jgi:hypothetical protein